MLEQLKRWGFRPIDANGQVKDSDEPKKPASKDKNADAEKIAKEIPSNTML